MRRLAPGFPRSPFLEVRYRVKSWRRLELCVEDARAGDRTRRASAGAEEVALLGFSMGGAVVGPGRRRSVRLDGDRARAVALPGARRLAARRPALRDRARRARPQPARACRASRPRSRGRATSGHEARGVDAVSDTVVRGAMHPIALRPPWGGTVPMPRAGRCGRARRRRAGALLRVGLYTACGERRSCSPGCSTGSRSSAARRRARASSRRTTSRCSTRRCSRSWRGSRCTSSRRSSSGATGRAPG